MTPFTTAAQSTRPLPALGWVCLLLVVVLASCVTPKQLAYFQPDPKLKSRIPIDSLVEAAVNEPITKGTILTISVNTTSPPDAKPINPFQPITIPGRPIDPVAAPGYLVDEQGNLELPLAGTVPAAGKTPQQIAATIRTRLQAFLPAPTVLVRYTTRVSVLGEVARPGVFTLNNTFITLPEALGLAGDLTSYARRDNVLIVRYVAGRLVSQELDLTKRSLLQSPYYILRPGDVVYVSPGKARAASVDRNYQIIPLALSALTVLATLTALILSRR